MTIVEVLLEIDIGKSLDNFEKAEILIIKEVIIKGIEEKMPEWEIKLLNLKEKK